MPKTAEKQSLSARDWEEDTKHHHGCHKNRCRVCGETFIGYRRRHICKKCITDGRK